MDDVLFDELKALLRLLDDPDETVRESVARRLQELGRPARTFLQDHARQVEPEQQRQIQAVLHAVHVATLEHAWQALMASPEVDLEEGAFLLARYGYPDLDPAPYAARLDAFAKRFENHYALTGGVEQAALLGAFLCDDLGFTGNQQQYYAPHNSYLNWVLDRRKGLPISLAVVYLLLGQRLGMPVYGVNMPAHFLVKYEAETELFLDLFHGATPLTREAGHRFLVKAGVEPQPSFFEATDHRTLLLRMARNLLYVAQKNQNSLMTADFTRFLSPDR